MINNMSDRDYAHSVILNLMVAVEDRIKQVRKEDIMEYGLKEMVARMDTFMSMVRKRQEVPLNSSYTLYTGNTEWDYQPSNLIIGENDNKGLNLVSADEYEEVEEKEEEKEDRKEISPPGLRRNVATNPSLPPLGEFMKELGIPFKGSLCRMAHITHQELDLCRKADNGLAHSLQEFSDQFSTAAMKFYFKASFNEYNVPYNMRQIFPEPRCHHCGVYQICYVNPVVVTHVQNGDNCTLVRPAIHINCFYCSSVTVISIYC